MHSEYFHILQVYQGWFLNAERLLAVAYFTEWY